MRENPTKVLASGAALADNTEHDVTVGALNDGKVYHVKSIHLVTEMDVADSSAFQITTDTDIPIWQGTALTQIGTGTLFLGAYRGIAAGFTDGLGGEVIVLPEKMIIPGGYKIKTVAELVSSIDHGILTIYGSVFKAL